MPQKNFERSKIYRITNTQDDKVYIGSTTKTYLSDRLWGHFIMATENRDNSSLHAHIRLLSRDCFNIELVEKYPQCTCSEELRQREQFHLDRVPADRLLNQRRAVYVITEQMRQRKKAQQKAYYKKNYVGDSPFRQKILEDKRLIYNWTKSWGGTYWKQCNMLRIDPELFAV